MLLNHTLVSSETFSGTFSSHEYRVIEISKFCSQNGSVRNGWKFPVAKWNELALRVWPSSQRPKNAWLGLSLTLCTIFKICSQFSKCNFLENRKISVSSKITF